ncbi:hypothetical protein DRE_00373 [Drechslerella stenobrocha 248]|uniref:Zn(2)-C6 fungal-type domain-containing protein n=1 Tax=Drechslerella stenobrocha 248 TaxID=1043628 RepID=W7IEF5_9PEZI|nr:hypothetical protein DRE_00373 [Drechslerella stenobrocha 248]
MSTAIDGSVKRACQATARQLDKAKRAILISGYAAAVNAHAASTSPAQPVRFESAAGSTAKVEQETKSLDLMEFDMQTPRQEDISRRSTRWLCDSILALDAHIKHQPDPVNQTINPASTCDDSPQTDAPSPPTAAYRRLSLPPGFALGRGAPFDLDTEHERKMSDGPGLPKEVDGVEVNPEWGLTKAGKARQRLPIACTNCRGKKVRCLVSKDGGPCHNCLKSDNLKGTCRTEGRPRRQSSGIKRDKSRSRKRSSGRGPSQNEDDSSTGISRASSRDPTDDDSMMLNVMDPSLLVFPAITPADIDPNYSHSGSPISNSSDIDRSHPLSLESLSSSYQQLFASGYSLESEGAYDARLLAPAPTSLGEHRMVSPLTKISLTSFPKQTRIQLPDEPTTRKLVELFFSHLHWQGYGFLQPSSFLRNLTSQSPILLLCICAVSCRLSDELRLTNSPRILEAQAKQAALGERFVPALTTIQAFLLLAFHYSATGDIDQANKYSDIAISMVKQIRLGDQIKDKLEQRENIGQAAIDPAIEIGKRTFWAAYIQDRSRHLTELLSPQQRLFTSNIPLPCPEAEFDLKSGNISVPQTRYGFTGNLGVMSYLVKIIDIRARLLQHLKISCTHLPQVYPAENSICDTRQLLAELTLWEETLPIEYVFAAGNFKGHFDGEHATIETICLMHLVYHTTLNQLHRYQNPTEDFLGHYLPCFKHALSVLAILRTVTRYNDEVAQPVGKRIQLVSPFLPLAIGVACDTIGRLLTYLPGEYILEDGRLLANPNVSLFFNGRKFFRESLQLLRSYMDRTKAAADTYVMIRKLCVDIREASTDGVTMLTTIPAEPHCVPGVCINKTKLGAIAPTMIPLNNSVVDILYHGEYFESWYRLGGAQDVEKTMQPATDQPRPDGCLLDISSNSLRLATTAHDTRPTEGYVTAVHLPQSTLAVFNLQVDASDSRDALQWTLPPGSTSAASAQGSPLLGALGQDNQPTQRGRVQLAEPFIHMGAPLTREPSATGSTHSITSTRSGVLPMAGPAFLQNLAAQWPPNDPTDPTVADMLGFEALSFMELDAGDSHGTPLNFSMEDMLTNPFDGINPE